MKSWLYLASVLLPAPSRPSGPRSLRLSPRPLWAICQSALSRFIPTRWSAAGRPRRWKVTAIFWSCKTTDPKLRAEAMRRLGDLNLESGELERMANEVTRLDLPGAEAIKLYTTLLKGYPDYARNDQVLYQLARAYETTGQSDARARNARPNRAPLSQDTRDRRGAVSSWRTVVLSQALCGRRCGLSASGQSRCRRLNVLRAGPVQTRLGAIQAIAIRRVSADVPDSAGSDSGRPQHWQGAQGRESGASRSRADG